MSLESALYTILSENTTLAAYVGDRIFPKTRGNCNTFPAIVYHRISTEQISSHDTAEGLSRVRVQVDCIGATLGSAHSAAAAVRGALNGYRGHVGGSWLTALRDNQTDGFENETGLYIISQDYFIYYQED